MHNFTINFSYPWLLLLLIPAIALTLIPYFRISKKYRRTRNRIVSITLHLLVMVMAISLLAGISFFFEVDNKDNEILFVVDVSDSTKEETEKRDDYINDVIALSDSEVFKIGIVTFGYTQVYAAPLTYDYGDVINRYLNSELPDTSASDIASALTFAKSCLTKPETAKIILISDGAETDGNALAVIRGLTADGTRIDTVRSSAYSPETEVQIIGAEVPDYNIATEEQFNIDVTLQNRFKEDISATVTVYDNDKEGITQEVALTREGVQKVQLVHSFATRGLHRLNFVVRCSGDSEALNNTFHTYVYLETFNKILIIENGIDKSERLEELLGDFEVDTFDMDSDKLPKTLEALREYDEIILNNISNADLQKVQDFDRILNEYVYSVGGGVFTVGGGEDGDPEKAHAYNRDDMRTSVYYQQMLPVQAINYTPPLGLAIVIDVSGSMSGERVESAKAAARSIVRDETCLSERDYCGVLTLSDDYEQISKMLPLTRQEDILDAIDRVGGSGGTTFTPSVEKAAADLRALYVGGVIEKMHVIIISDMAASDYDEYSAAVEREHATGVTFSFVAVDATPENFSQAEHVAQDLGGGRAHRASAANMTETLREDIRVPEIQEVKYADFKPTINKDSYYASVITQDEMPTLNGFYGTRVRQNAEVVLSGEYNVPIYAQWKYGAGTVGSFMCDLSGVWSSDFITLGGAGHKLITSIVNKLFPTENIRPRDLDATLREDNYTNNLSIFSSKGISSGESVRVKVENLTNPAYEVQIIEPSETDGYTRSTFICKEPGIYRITLEKYSGDEIQPNSYVFYKAFSYSEEYNLFTDDEERTAYMDRIAELGGGEAYALDTAEAWTVFEGFVIRLPKIYDPRLLFMVLAIVMFLLDIAVRKFKFKWPHELIREYREKKDSKKN